MQVVIVEQCFQILVLVRSTCRSSSANCVKTYRTSRASVCSGSYLKFWIMRSLRTSFLRAVRSKAWWSRKAFVCRGRISQPRRAQRRATQRPVPTRELSGGGGTPRGAAPIKTGTSGRNTSCSSHASGWPCNTKNLSERALFFGRLESIFQAPFARFPFAPPGAPDFLIFPHLLSLKEFYQTKLHGLFFLSTSFSGPSLPPVNASFQFF